MPILASLWFVLVACGLWGCAGRETPTAISRAPARDFRAGPPPVPPAPELALPRFLEARTRNGVRVLSSERHALPIVSLNLAFAAGSASDPDSQAGLAALAYGLLLEGAGDRDAAELAAAFALLGATPVLQVEPDGALLSVTVQTERLPEAVALLSQVALHPRFTEAGFERRKAQQLADLAAFESEPSYVAQRAFLSLAYGPTHPYGHTYLGTSESVARLSFQDAREFHMRRIGPETLAVIITGDVDPAHANALVEQHFGAWRTPARAPAAPVLPPQRRDGPIVYVERSGLNQTTLLVGRPTIPAGHPQEAALDIASAIVGGLFSSRLNLNLRERHGYSYGVKARFSPRRGPGPWVAYTAVRADVTAAALNELMGELSALPVRPFSERETDEARRSLTAALPGEFETAGDLAAAAARIHWYAQPLDRYALWVAKLRQATAGDVEEAGILYMQPASLHVVAVGDPQVLQTQLARVQLNPPREVKAWAALQERIGR
jgi:zinc protease